MFDIAKKKKKKKKKRSEKFVHRFAGDQAQCPLVLFFASSPEGRRPSTPKEGDPRRWGYACLQEHALGPPPCLRGRTSFKEAECLESASPPQVPPLACHVCEYLHSEGEGEKGEEEWTLMSTGKGTGKGRDGQGVWRIRSRRGGPGVWMCE